jgi:hypothetical protein
MRTIFQVTNLPTSDSGSAPEVSLILHLNDNALKLGSKGFHNSMRVDASGLGKDYSHAQRGDTFKISIRLI